MTGPVLRDIHLPAAHWWPPAPGWWLLAALLLLVVVAAAWWFRRFALGAPLREAMREVDALETAHARDGDGAALAEGASCLMRRIALRVSPAAASQTGEAWRAFVDRHAHADGTRRVLGQLIDERFRAHPVLDASALPAALRTWCRDALRGRVARDADDMRVAGKAVRA
jgi:hypothetical protein